MRIAVVNDTLMVAEVLKRIVTNLSGCELAWVAYDGIEAVNKCALDTPDLILMDVVMPKMDGVEATRQIMERSPCAILMVTVCINRYAAKVFEAMGYGALDAVNTPILFGQESDESTGLQNKIATIARLIGKSSRQRSQLTPPPINFTNRKRLLPLIAIGASTGGPQALKTILSQFPTNINAAVVIVQHIDAEFAQGFATWLNEHVSIPVQLAIPGCFPEPGKVLVAGTNHHLVIRADLSLAYEKQPLDCVYRPSVDVFFESLAKYWQGKGVGVLLTGMGRDGAAGLKLIRERGWYTIAQNQESCIVYGMPKAAVELKAPVKVLPIEAIAPHIMKHFKSTAKPIVNPNIQ